ncbi:leucine-rich repeat protein [Lysinibacillus sp. M3]|uniref:Leucine-rich repeat protein n=1 Tax=Lysinibacillus zambalensis TaxID=3160866 RepID=A0ABV1MX91_9BACI
MKNAFLLLASIILVFSQLSLGSLSVYAISNAENDIVLPNEHENEREAPNNEAETVTSDNEDEAILPNDSDDNISSPSNNDEEEMGPLNSEDNSTILETKNEEGYITNDVGNSVVIIGYQGDKSDIVIPSEINGKPVIEIGDEAFSGKQLTNVTIPSSVKMIGKFAFSNNQLTSIEIPSSMTTIGIYAFSSNQLTSIEIPSSMATIATGAFSYNRLTSVEIPSSVTTIGGHAFINNRLTSVEIPSSVTTIGGYAFYQNRLISIEIPSSVTTIETSAFFQNQLTSIEIPSSVTTIGSHAFSQNQLTSIKIPSSVTTIEMGAFSNNQLTSIEIPSGMTTIESDVFSGNRLTSVEIPPSVTTIGSYAFSHNRLTSIEIPSSVTTIGSYAFYQNQLTSIEIPSSVTTIEMSAFSNNHLTSIEIPPGVTTIGERAFSSNHLDFVIFHGAPEFQWANPTPFEFQYKSGKSFLGWFEDEDHTINWSNSVSKAMTIYAKWSPLTVKFDANGGSEVPSQTVEYDEVAKVPSPPVKAGNTFEGWYKDKELTKAWDFDYDVVKNDITLYAKWSKASYIVTFEANGGSEVPSQSVEYGELIKAPSTPVKAGYTFGGWYKDKGLTDVWDFTKDAVTKNVTLYAKWTKDHTSGGGSGGGSDGGSPNYKVIFDSNGGSKVPSQTVGYNDLGKAPATPVKEGYQFEGWYKDKEFNNAWDFAKDKVTADITLYAKWTKDYIVTFESNGGSKIPSQTVPYKALVKAPSNPKKKGYLFIGWYKNDKFTKAWDFAKDVVTEDLTLYARWMKDSKRCDITFEDIDRNWAQDMIKEVAKRCIIIGYPDGTFRPNDVIQRQHVVLMIDRALQPASVREAVSFSDVPKSHVNYEQITRLQQAGIVDGSNGAFRPNASITRAEMAKILVLAFGLTPEGNSTFKDVDPSHWASGYIAALVDHNIALGDENGNFRPNDNLTRAEFTACVYRALGL